MTSLQILIKLTCAHKKFSFCQISGSTNSKAFAHPFEYNGNNKARQIRNIFRFLSNWITIIKCNYLKNCKQMTSEAIVFDRTLWKLTGFRDSQAIRSVVRTSVNLKNGQFCNNSWWLLATIIAKFSILNVYWNPGCGSGSLFLHLWHQSVS